MELKRYQSVGAVGSEDFSNLQFIRNNYVVNGNPVQVNTARGKAFEFDGANDAFEINDDKYNVGTGDFSVVIFYKGFGANGYLAAKSDGSAPYWFVRTLSSKFQARVNDGANSVLVNSTTSVDDNVFHTLIATFDRSGNMIVYVDGVNEGSASISAVGDLDNSGNLGFGQFGSGASGRLSDSIKDFIFFKRVLAPQEVSDIHNNVAFDYEKNVVSEWDMSNPNPQDVGWRNLGNDGTGTNMDSTNTVNGIGGGKAQSFNGSNEYVAVGALDGIDWNGNSSISCWIKTDADGIWAVHRRSSAVSLIDILILSGKARYEIRDEALNTVQVSSNVTVNDDSWHHIAITVDFDNSIGCIFIDGGADTCEVDLSTIVGGMGTGGTFRISGDNTGSFLFDGLIDNVIVFDRALTGLQASDLYNKQLGGLR
jgi:hypothetical protein